MGKKKKTDMMLCNGIMSALPMISQINKPGVEPGKNILDDMIMDIDDSGAYMGLETGTGKDTTFSPFSRKRMAAKSSIRS